MTLEKQLSKEDIKFQIITDPPKPLKDDIERCVQRKMAAGKTRAQARRECIADQKRPITVAYAQQEKLTNDRANLRAANPQNPGERCGKCQYFEEPTVCKIVEGPVSTDAVCDWIQSRDTDAPKYDIKDEDWVAFGKGMIEKQPYQHKVIDVALTPEGPLVLIEDTIEPTPHKFSLTKDFHIEHTSLEHHWTQEEVDAILEAGKKQSDEEEALSIENPDDFVEGETDA